MTDRPEPRSVEGNPPVVAAVDGSAVSYRGAAWAAVEATLHGCGLLLVTSLVVSTGFGRTPVLTDDDLSWLEVEAERVIAEAYRVARAAAPGEALEISTEVTREPIIARLHQRSRQARMLVVGSRGLGMIRRELLGSVGTAMTRHAQCPVAVVHSSSTDAVSAHRPVLVGVDGTPNSVPAIDIAFEEASLRKVGLVALHAWTDIAGSDVPLLGWDETVHESEGALLAESLAGWSERYPDVPVRRILVRDRPARALVDESENAGLVVVGSHGRGGFTGMLLGSTSATVVQSVDCPVIVVR
ncbi:universal stress protein [Nocardia vaccinii]|uniref:universal stress protein n=1 Tax=Nocardia vaccinii TaxID=1822 RepID=UPI00082EF0D2|nr:universal stress protein [Nocardia vaccinii]